MRVCVKRLLQIPDEKKPPDGSPLIYFAFTPRALSYPNLRTQSPDS